MNLKGVTLTEKESVRFQRLLARPLLKKMISCPQADWKKIIRSSQARNKSYHQPNQKSVASPEKKKFSTIRSQRTFKIEKLKKHVSFFIRKNVIIHQKHGILKKTRRTKASHKFTTS